MKRVVEWRLPLALLGEWGVCVVVVSGVEEGGGDLADAGGVGEDEWGPRHTR